MRSTHGKPVLVVLFCAVAHTAFSATWYVNGSTGSDSNNCKSSTAPCSTIRQALFLAAQGDTIRIAAAIYTENLNISNSIHLTGAAAATTIIDGTYTTRVLSILSTSAQVVLTKLTIRNGVSAGGGGILNWGTLTVNNSTISGNSAASEYASGSGIYNSGTLTINNSTFSGNGGAAGAFVYGGAIYNSGTLAINNSTLSANSAVGITGGGGGGIYNAGTAKISSTTISGNSGTPFGGGIYNVGTATIQNTIVANNNSGGNCHGTVTSHGYNLSSDNSCSFHGAGDRNSVNPVFGPLQNNGGQTQTMALLPGSPALDGGDPAGCTDNNGQLLKMDQRGSPRPDKAETSGCDIGSYENQVN